MGDPFLNYFALFLLIFVVVVLFSASLPYTTFPPRLPRHGIILTRTRFTRRDG
jgi:hypothetical protein